MEAATVVPRVPPGSGAGVLRMNDLTPEARRLIEWLRGERRFWNEQAHEDEVNTFVRHGAISRRDQLDTVIAKVESALPEVERQAIAIEARTDDLLAQLIESVP